METQTPLAAVRKDDARRVVKGVAAGRLHRLVLDHGQTQVATMIAALFGHGTCPGCRPDSPSPTQSPQTVNASVLPAFPETT